MLDLDPRTPTRGAATRQVLRAQYRPPYAFGLILDFLRGRAVAGVEHATEDSYCRSLELDGAVGTFCVRDDPANSALVFEVALSEARELGAFETRVRKMFDLDADPRVINAVLRRDPRLAPLVRRHPGLRIPGAWCSFETLIRAVLGQQVSVRAATTLATRLVARYGTALPEELTAGAVQRTFPSAHELARADSLDVAVPARRRETLLTLARAHVSGALPFDATLSYAAFLKALQAIPGIGPWTAEYAALRCLGERDAFPAGDLVLRQVMSEPGALCSVRALTDLAETWRPWRGYAALHLWRTVWKP